MVASAKLGIDVRFCGPKSLQPDQTLTETCLALAAETGAQIRLFLEPEEAVKGADFVCTHSWHDDDEQKFEERVKKLLPYRATTDLLAQSGTGRCFVLHNLPLVLSDETEEGGGITEKFRVDGLEMSRELFDSSSNLSFEQAENQLHCCKAVLVALLS
jgi:ornithine carbamoyltransferase